MYLFNKAFMLLQSTRTFEELVFPSLQMLDSSFTTLPVWARLRNKTGISGLCAKE